MIPASIRILGIDPGSRITGYGVIDSDGRHNLYVASGVIRAGDGDIGPRLRLIFEGVREIIREFSPQELAIESVFMARNADSALKLGQARGAAICAALDGDLAMSEYSARSVKQAVVGTGAAGKEQVQHMIRILLNLDEAPAADAADALAVALCHAHGRNLKTVVEARRR